MEKNTCPRLIFRQWGDDRLKYFAYGSNMNIAQMRSRCRDRRPPLGVATLDNHRLIINVDGYASIVKAPGSRVIGVLWEISRDCEKALDEYEEVPRGLYSKAQVSVKMANGTSTDALVYIASDESIGSPRPGYLEKIIMGAKENHLPIDYVERISRLGSSGHFVE
ncbi:MAG: gamma-glutamylcyclotransferase family protein [Methanomassiliicoccus sp.]|nr:gamma-glutamylcyclotransferase family protein [Methanomassiliicoccus sp.]